MIIEGEKKVEASVDGPERGPGSRYWLIVKSDSGLLDAPIIYLDGQEAMPIFSFREEAEMFVRLEAQDGWRVKEISAGELASLLSGPYSRLEMVALDPLPKICHEGMTRLVSLSTKDFARVLLNNRKGRGAPTPV